MWIIVENHSYIDKVRFHLQSLGIWSDIIKSEEHYGLVVRPYSANVSEDIIMKIQGVQQIFTPQSPHPKIDKHRVSFLNKGSQEIFLDKEKVLMAGPCSVESEEQIHKTAKIIAKSGAQFLRAGAFKPRTSPYSFQGHGKKALYWLKSAADQYNLGVITEVMSEYDVEEVSNVVDIIQVGSRNMQNYSLLSRVGKCGKTVLLKRGMSAKIEEWLFSAEHLLCSGATKIIFCERGIVNFDPKTRNLLDLGAVALLKHVYKQCVVVDPSHSSGRHDLIKPLAQAAIAVGADGLLIEAHHKRGEALSDGPQAIDENTLNSISNYMGIYK